MVILIFFQRWRRWGSSNRTTNWLTYGSAEHLPLKMAGVPKIGSRHAIVCSQWACPVGEMNIGSTHVLIVSQSRLSQRPLYWQVEQTVFAGFEQIKIVFVDGVFSPDLSDDFNDVDVRIEMLSDVHGQENHWASNLYGVLEAAGQSPVERPMAALNTALAQEGVLLHVTGQASKPIHLVYLRENESSDVLLHHVIKVDSGASLQLLESGPAAARSNLVLETEIAKSGSFRHVRIQGRDHERLATTHHFARLQENSTFKSFSLTANGVLTRNECIVEMCGDDGVAHVAGACVGDGEFLHDDTVFVTHDALNCESRQVFKKSFAMVLREFFKGKF